MVIHHKKQKTLTKVKTSYRQLENGKEWCESCTVEEDIVGMTVFLLLVRALAVVILLRTIGIAS